MTKHLTKAEKSAAQIRKTGKVKPAHVCKLEPEALKKTEDAAYALGLRQGRIIERGMIDQGIDSVRREHTRGMIAKITKRREELRGQIKWYHFNDRRIAELNKIEKLIKGETE